MFKSISQSRYEAYFYGRSPHVKAYTKEVAWYAYDSGHITLLAVVLYCKIDHDYNVVILARDLVRRFRAAGWSGSWATIEEAMQDASSKIPAIEKEAIEGLVSQGDEGPSPFDIFASKVPEHKQNRYLKLLLNDPTYYPAKIAMEELANWFEDPDGIFIRGLQGNEFNSRLFELYLQAVFYEMDFVIDHSHPQPDYLLSKNGAVVSVEAATVAEFDGEEEVEPRRFGEETLSDLFEHVEKVMPFKFQRTLAKKVRHRPEPLRLPYWELPHTKGHPFLIAIHDYSRTMSMATSQGALQKYLYGLELVDGVMMPIERHEFEGRTIASNFFGQVGNRHVSAVMLATGATLPKFNRMGRLAGVHSPTSVAAVSGIRTNDKGEMGPFSAIVEKSGYQEAWHDGIYIFHNPNAVIPFDPELFPRAIHCFQVDDGIREYFPPNFIVGSVTRMFRFDESERERVWRELDLVTLETTGQADEPEE